MIMSLKFRFMIVFAGSYWFFIILFRYSFLPVLRLPCCMGFFSGCGEPWPLSSCGTKASRWVGFSGCRAQALGLLAAAAVACGLSSCSSWALEPRFSCCGPWAQLLHGMWNLPGPGIKPVSPALAGRGRFLPLSHQGSPILIFVYWP